MPAGLRSGVVATHYDVLGVSSSASLAEVRRAYLDLARTLHPDRTVGSSAREAEQASRRMQEINEAWRVLREPASRAAYDRAVGVVHRPARAASPWAPPRHLADDDDDLDTPFRSAPAEPGDIGVSVVRALPWVAVLFILGVIFVFTAFAGGNDDPRRPGELVGRCISSGSGGGSGVVVVPCQGPNDGQVALVVNRSSLCPEGTTSRPMEDRYLCVRPVTEVPVFTPTTGAGG